MIEIGFRIIFGIILLVLLWTLRDAAKFIFDLVVVVFNFLKLRLKRVLHIG